MRISLLFLIVSFGCLSVSAQQPLPLNEPRYLDSLNKIIQTGKQDSLKAGAAFLLVDFWKVRDSVKSKAYLSKAMALMHDSPYLHALSFFYQAQYYSIRNPKKAAALFKQAEVALRNIHTKASYEKQASAWFYYALMEYNAQGYAFIARITLDHVIPLANQSGDMEKVAHYYAQLSTILMNNYQFAKATAYDQKAIALLEKHAPKSSALAIAYLNGVSIYCYDSQAKKAGILLQKAWKLLFAFPSSVNHGLYYFNEALYYHSLSAFPKALISAQKGIEMAKKYNQLQLYQMLVFRKYEAYKQMQNYNGARQLLQGILKEGTLMANVNDRVTLYSELSGINAKLKDYQQAYEWLNKSKAASDSINANNTKLKINELELRYRKSEDRQRMVRLQGQARQVSLMAQNRYLWMWLFGMGCLVLVLVLIFVILHSRSRKKLSAQREINLNQKLEEMERRQQFKVAMAMLDGEERERERVARDLHDGLGGMLAGLKIGLSGWKDQHPEVSGNTELQRLIGHVDTSVTELRTIARNMVPETLLQFGLEVALKDLCEFHMRDGLHIAFEAFHIQKPIAISDQLHIYRIAQELLFNALKHAHADNIILQCTQHHHCFLITIEDNGIGFNSAELNKNKGMGLNSIRNRVDFLGGAMEIISSPGEGTTINIELKTDAER